jgi:uncharacterized surface protein with fasciclin (FAS1) repeats
MNVLDDIVLAPDCSLVEDQYVKQPTRSKREPMRNLATLTLILALAPATLVDAADGDTPTKNLVEVAIEAGTFKSLAAALDAAGLVETLQGEGPFTVFAPTDAAFEKLPVGTVESLLKPANKQQLIAILTTHVVAGRVDATSALTRKTLDSLQGEPLTVKLSGGVLTVNGLRVSSNDIQTKNGVIHVIDSVLLPTATPSPGQAVFDLLELAIERGAPLFNDGQRGACADIYEIAVRSIVDRPQDLPKSLVSDLRRALTDIRSSNDKSEDAWTLRRAIDRVMLRLAREELNASRTAKPARESAKVEKVVFGFEDSDHEWIIVNDDVMGGISKASTQLSGNGTKVFQGALSLEQNGGFATTRSRARDLELAGYKGLVMRVRGDGRTYGISGLPSSRRGELNIWQDKFTTTAGEWAEIQVPFDSLTRNVMGRRLPRSGALPQERLRSIAFSIADKDESPFRLEVDWIKAYK